MSFFGQLGTSDIPFARDDAHRLLPVMIACLTAFAALLLSIALSINTTLDARSRDAIGMLQVEVPRTKADTALNAITDEIKRTKGVTSVAVLTNAQMEALLKPWLGTNFSLADLPIPVLLDVRTTVDNDHTTVDVDALQRTLTTKYDSAIRIDDSGPWVAHVAKASALLQALVVFIALTLLACVIGMIVLVSKTNLRLHFKAVSLLHMFGATDEYILRQFQWNSAWLAGRGALAGVIFAGIIFCTGVILSMRWESAVLPQINFTLAHGVVFAVLPVLTAMISLVATRLTVQSMLEHMH